MIKGATEVQGVGQVYRADVIEEPKAFRASIAAATTTALVAAVPGRRIVVISLTIIAKGGAQTLALLAGSTAKFGSVAAPWPCSSDGTGGAAGLSLPFNPAGHFETGVDEALSAVTGTAEAVEIFGKYVEAEFPA